MGRRGKARLLEFLDPEGGVRDVTFRRNVFDNCLSGCMSKNEKKGMTKATFKTLLAWAQAELNKQLAQKMLFNLKIPTLETCRA